MNQKKKKIMWLVILSVFLVLEVVLAAVAVYSIWTTRQTAIELWKIIVFVGIAVWIYIAYLKQRSLDMSKFVVDEKIKTHALIHALREGILVIDSELRLLIMNDNAASLLGMSEIEWLGKSLQPVFDPETVKFISAGRSGAIEATCLVSGKKIQIEVLNLPAGPDMESHKLIYVFELPAATPAAATAAEENKEYFEQTAAAISRAARALVETAGAPAGDTTALETLCASIRLSDAAGGVAAAPDAKPSRISIESLLSKTVSGLAPVLNAAKIELDISHAVPAQPVAGDLELLQAALLRIILNAAASSGASSRITVKTAPLGDRASILVFDNGPAVAPDALEQLFAHHYAGVKTPDGKNAREKACGLAEARRIIEAAGGILSAESRPDRGLNVAVMLPAALE